MSRLEIQWPDEGAERVRAARSRLILAGPALRAMSLEDRLSAVAKLIGDWSAPDSPWRRELAATLGEASSFRRETIAEGLESALRAWRPEDLIECVRNELAPMLSGGRRQLVPFDWTTVIAGGSIPMPTMLSCLLPLVVGSPVLLRETSKDPVTARILARSLAARDERLARSFEPVSFPASDRAAYDLALEAPCVVATGSDETISEIASRLHPRQRLVAYGHRFSIVVLGAGVADSAETLRQAAMGIALDVARWDQSGCLSPIVVYLLEIESDSSKAIARAIAEALTDLAPAMPRGDVDTASRAVIAVERSEARMRSTSGQALLFEGPEHTVVLESDARPRPAPLHRFLRLMPIASHQDLIEALGPFAGHLSTVAVAGVDRRSQDGAAAREPEASSVAALMVEMSRLGVSRFTEPGQMQTPRVDWPHDGMPLVVPFARFADFVLPDSLAR